MEGRLSLARALGIGARQGSELDDRWPGLMDRLCEPGPRLRRHIRVFVNQTPAELATPVGAGERIDILTAITGG